MAPVVAGTVSTATSTPSFHSGMYFCGTTFDQLNCKYPCPGGLDSECSNSQTCFIDAGQPQYYCQDAHNDNANATVTTPPFVADTKSPYLGGSPFVNELPLPKVIDLRGGGKVTLYTSLVKGHNFGDGITASVYGYGATPDSASFPGPTILTKKGVPVEITYSNTIAAPHLLDSYIAAELIHGSSSCYPDCGVPVVTHLHGAEVPAAFDGSPDLIIREGESSTYTYSNNQPAGTLVYHDHALGFTRLNAWAGLVGAYIIEDEGEAAKNLMPECDIPLIITDRSFTAAGELLYPESPCTIGQTNWAPEAFGDVQLVNGVMMPFVKVPNRQCRLRFINASNARTYGLHLPFGKSCVQIAKDAILQNRPSPIAKNTIRLMSYERIDMICDFSKSAGKTFSVMDVSIEAEEVIEAPVLQLRVSNGPLAKRYISPVIPDVINQVKDMKALWSATKGVTKDITLDEIVDDDDCPTQLTITQDFVSRKSFMLNMGSYNESLSLTCKEGTVERWLFHNPTADFHPFHWHVVRAQCGATEATVDTNQLVDVIAIPNNEGNFAAVTQVCYVACFPGNDAIEPSEGTGITISNKDTELFDFNLQDPYVTHCHILEHEENDMMSYFAIESERVVEKLGGGDVPVSAQGQLPTSSAVAVSMSTYVLIVAVAASMWSVGA